MNLVVRARLGERTVTNSVLPLTRCDLYSYSAYDSISAASSDPELRWSPGFFREALDYLAERAPDSAAFGGKNVYVGEFGWPEVRSVEDPHTDSETSLRVTRMTTEEALAWGCPFMVYWQVYDNEARRRPPANEDARGFYLIRPDGTPGPAFEYFWSMLGRPPRRE